MTFGALDFQSIIIALQQFWADQGCLIWQPYYAQVGAGTMNPATFLRVLGPEPWNVAYVEPSIRPDDGRFGENPNRMQQHYQFQVILKPDPGNPQELYLQSLQAVGIDPHQHDIRFVEDNWESPALGAWGLGWEVWLDGQEITQFTYFQQAGGMTLDPVSVELTYGLDRIAIALQRVRGFQEIRWNEVSGEKRLPGRSFTAGDVNLQPEQEHSKYYFEIADVQRLRQMYDLYEAEANAALSQNLVFPAYDYVLKCSHTFNVLDTRGAIGVTERQAYFGRMRDLARRVAEVYLEKRQRLEFPWLDALEASRGGDVGKSSGMGTGGVRMPAATDQTASLFPENPAPLIFEIGTEELPAPDLDAALDQLRQRVPALLEELRLKHSGIRVMGTPRRLVVTVADLEPRQENMMMVVKGPPANRAFDEQGKPTPAAEGFARGKGVAVDELQIREMDGGSYVVAVVHATGRLAEEVLGEALPGLISSLRFEKSMRWNSNNVAFSRPIRWLMALIGSQVITFEYAGLVSGDHTRGLRFHDPEEFRVRSVDDYKNSLATQGILLESEERQRIICEQVGSLAEQVGGQVVSDLALLAEVTNLVEAPLGILGSFNSSHLDLPREVLISVMKKHQRYFPVERDGNLLPYFIAICNRGADHGSIDTSLIVEGNEHVIQARFADAAFFVDEDLKRPLEAYVPQLQTLIFQTRLGSMLDKTRRICELVIDLAAQVGLDDAELAIARRAAKLCKADLVTKMVVEMTSLQGVMGRYYAQQSGEPEAVATAIFEHYLPRFADDAVPTFRPGLAVGLADRLDSLAGLFAAGLAPTGAKDPFGQRRAALGLVSNLIAWDLDFNLTPAVSAAAARLPIPIAPESQAACLSFISERLRNWLLEGKARFDVVDAVLVSLGKNPAAAYRAVKELTAWVERPDWHKILPAYARCVRITRDQSERFTVDPAAFVEEGERELYKVLLDAEAKLRAPGSVDDFLNAFLPMIPAINRFFDEVLVMDELAIHRQNRLGMLQRISALAEGVADMSRLEGF